MRSFIPVIFLVFMCISGCSSSPDTVGSRNITVIFRYDDFSSQSPTKLEVKLIELLRKYHASATFAVIPLAEARSIHTLIPLSDDKCAILEKGVSDGTLSVAQHGYTHQALFKGSEFAGIPLDRQLARIAAGKSLIEQLIGYKIVTFVPPGNSYDENTLRALNRLGFKCISACNFGPIDGSCELKFLPETTTIGRLERSVEAARSGPDLAPIIVVMMHPYDFREIDSRRCLTNLSEFENTLRWLSDQRDVRISTIEKALQSKCDLGAKQFVENESYQRDLRFISPFQHPIYGVYMGQHAVHGYRVRSLLLAGIICLLGVAFSFAIFSTTRIWCRRRNLSRSLCYVRPLMLALLVAYPFRDLSVGWRDVIVLSVAMGGCIEMIVWLCMNRFRRSAGLKGRKSEAYGPQDII